MAAGTEHLRSHRYVLKTLERLQFNSRCGQAAGGHGDWLEQDSGRHVNELNGTYLSCLSVQNP